MSLNLNGEKCAVCNAYLFDDDDVVYCPECGAPHHRECYSAIGHCGLQEFHGTEKQYKKPEVKKEQEPKNVNNISCSICGKEYDSSLNSCPSCNAPNMTKFGGRVVTFDLTGGVPLNTELDDGITAKDVKDFVGNNSHRYMHKFLKFKKGKKASWNWLAFLTPCGWLLSRKMYILGAIIGALQIALALIGLPFVAAINQFDLSQAKNYIEISNIVLENISVIGTTVILFAFLGSFIDLFIRIIIAAFGDYIYKNRVMTNIKQAKNGNIDKEEYYRKKGGISFIAAIIGYFAVTELPTIIAYALGML